MFTHIVINNKTEAELKEKTEFMAPMWCGVQHEPSEDRKETLSDYIEELLDVLMMEDIDETDSEEEAEEDQQYDSD